MRGLKVIILLSAMGSIPASGALFSMDPWIITLEPQSLKVSQILTFKHLSNSGMPAGRVQGPTPNDVNNEPVPIEISITTREITENGQVIYPSSSGAENFVIYPSQLILYPGDIKKVQVQWVGTKIPSKETAFGLIATQLPLAVGANREAPKVATAMVNVMTRYEGILVVRPKEVKPAIVVDTVYSRTDSSGLRMVLILNNKGTGLQNLKGMNVEAVPQGNQGKMEFNRKIKFQANLSADATLKSVFAGYRRIVDFPWPKELPLGPTSVTVTFPAGGK